MRRSRNLGRFGAPQGSRDSFAGPGRFSKVPRDQISLHPADKLHLSRSDVPHPPTVNKHLKSVALNRGPGVLPFTPHLNQDGKMLVSVHDANPDIRGDLGPRKMYHY